MTHLLQDVDKKRKINVIQATAFLYCFLLEEIRRSGHLQGHASTVHTHTHTHTHTHIHKHTHTNTQKHTHTKHKHTHTQNTHIHAHTHTNTHTHTHTHTQPSRRWIYHCHYAVLGYLWNYMSSVNNISYVVGHEGDSGLMYQCIMSERRVYLKIN
jgi:hypothetical protein